MKVAALVRSPVAQHFESIVRSHPIPNADRPGRLFDDPVVVEEFSELFVLSLELRDPPLLGRGAEPRFDRGANHGYSLHFSVPISPSKD